MFGQCIFQSLVDKNYLITLFFAILRIGILSFDGHKKYFPELKKFCIPEHKMAVYLLANKYFIN